MLLTALVLVPADAAPPTALLRDWSSLEHRLSVCPASWSDVVGAHTKAGLAGTDTVGDEYATGWVYANTFPPVKVTLYDAYTDTVKGAAAATATGLESTAGRVVDIEPVLLTNDCHRPARRPIYAVRVTTTRSPHGFLTVVL